MYFYNTFYVFFIFSHDTFFMLLSQYASWLNLFWVREVKNCRLYVNVNFFLIISMLFWCQENINECLSKPCFHQGVCHDEVNDFSCKCQDGWTGKQCEKLVDYCNTNSCTNNAVCFNLFKTYYCRWDIFYFSVQLRISIFKLNKVVLD